MAAKPSIDIDLLVEDTENESLYVPVLEGRGSRLVSANPGGMATECWSVPKR